MKALLVIGLQNDFLPGGLEEIQGIETVVKEIKKLWAAYPNPVAVNYSLPPTHLMFAGNHLWRKPGQVIDIGGHQTRLHSMFCIQNSFGAENPDFIARSEKQLISLGTKDDYLLDNAFSHAGGVGETGLQEWLQSQGITELVITGLPLEAMVKSTALMAKTLDYTVTVIPPACASKDETHKAKTLELLEDNGIILLRDFSL